MYAASTEPRKFNLFRFPGLWLRSGDNSYLLGWLPGVRFEDRLRRSWSDCVPSNLRATLACEATGYGRVRSPTCTADIDMNCQMTRLLTRLPSSSAAMIARRPTAALSGVLLGCS